MTFYLIIISFSSVKNVFDDNYDKNYEFTMKIEIQDEETFYALS